MKSKFVRFTGCVVGFFLCVATIFYVIYFFGIVCGYNVSWISTFFLYYGLAAFLIPLPMLVKSTMITMCTYDKHCDCSTIEK